MLGILGVLSVIVGGFVVLQHVDPTGPADDRSHSVGRAARVSLGRDRQVLRSLSLPRYPRSPCVGKRPVACLASRCPSASTTCVAWQREFRRARRCGRDSRWRSSWRRERLPDGLTTLGRFSCTSSGWCAAVAYGTATGPSLGVFSSKRTTWGRAGQRRPFARHLQRSHRGIDCPQPGDCLVTAPLGRSVLVTHDFGRSWVISAPLPHFSPAPSAHLLRECQRVLSLRLLSGDQRHSTGLHGSH